MNDTKTHIFSAFSLQSPSLPRSPQKPLSRFTPRRLPEKPSAGETLPLSGRDVRVALTDAQASDRATFVATEPVLLRHDGRKDVALDVAGSAVAYQVNGEQREPLNGCACPL